MNCYRQLLKFPVFHPYFISSSEETMLWELCIQYANGTEQVLRAFRDLETAENCVDRLYAQGYPMHIAYLIRLAYTV